MRWSDKYVKNWQNLTISNPKPDLYNVNAHTKFGEDSFYIQSYQLEKKKYGCSENKAGNTVKNWWNLPNSNPKTDLDNNHVHTLSLVKIRWHLLE